VQQDSKDILDSLGEMAPLGSQDLQVALVETETGEHLDLPDLKAQQVDLGVMVQLE